MQLWYPLGGNQMTERVRRRASKWDLQENSATFSVGATHDDASVNKVTESIHENEAKPDWVSKNTGSRTKWSDTNTDGGFKSEGNSRQQGWGPSSGNRAERNGDNVSMNVNEVSPNMKKWDENRSYSTSISPRRDDWRQQSRSRSPRRGWSNSHRSRSRSPPHGLRKRSRSPPHGLRNRSRSPPHGLRNRSRSPPRGFRNRSRSPPHGLKRDPEGRTDRVRGESRVPLCNDFTKGRCTRGDQCRFLHEGSFGHANNVERDYSRDRISHGHERDTRSYSGPDQRREPYRTVIPCRYFASGNCRKGTSCRFSHEGAAHEQPQGGSNWRPEAAQGSVVGPPLNNVTGHTANNAWEASEWTKKLTNNEDKAVQGRPHTRSADERWVHNVSDVNKSWGGSTWGDEAPDSADGSVAGRPVNGGGDRISNSGWDDPAYNKTFVGWIPNGQALTDRPEGRSMEESLDHNMLDERKSHEGQKWGVEAVGSTNYTVEGRSVNDGRGQIANTSSGDPRWMKQPTGPTWNDVAADSELKKVPKWGNDGKSEQAGGVDENKLLGDGQWSNNASAPKVSKTPDWADNKDGDVKNVATVPGPPQMSLGDRSYSLENQNRTWGVPTWSTNPSETELIKAPEWGTVNEVKSDAGALCAMNRSVDVKTDYNLGDQNRTWGVSTWSNKPSDQDVHKATQISRGTEEVVSFTNQQPAGGAEKEQNPHFIGNEKAGFGVQDQQSHAQMFSHGQYSTQGVASQQHNPITPLYVDGEKHPTTTAITHPTSSNMISQSQQPLLSSSPVIRSFDLNGPVEDVPSPKHQSLFHMVETIKAGKVDPIVPPMTNAPIATQSTVTSEQVAQISHLSASLAQIFGNGQQLPQLYATLNSTSSVGLAAPGPISGRVDAPVGGSFVQSNQDTWSQQQYGAVSSSMALSQISSQPQAFSENPIHGNNTTNHGPQTQLQSSVLSSMTVGPNGSGLAINDNLQKTFQHGNEAKQLESVGNERAAEGIVKEQGNANARSGDTNADGRVDEDDKKSKETKAMRMFKFALVEFVKEILKPTWREGLLSKEAHKTIVKKVVDKVTGAVQGEHIPQTQEKIDQYMAYSKIKLTKLVEAYVEKYVKS